MYNTDYFYNMLRMYSSTAECICRARWEFVLESGVSGRNFGKDELTVLDYGAGCGFFKAFAPNRVLVDTFDVMDVPQTGIRREEYDLITFWDVLEHIPDLMSLKPIFDRARWVAVTVPIKPADVPWAKYKHFKPGEHIHHFQEDYLCAVLDLFGFELFKSGTPECPPREMIGSFLFRRVR